MLTRPAASLLSALLYPSSTPWSRRHRPPSWPATCATVAASGLSPSSPAPSISEPSERPSTRLSRSATTASSSACPQCTIRRLGRMVPTPRPRCWSGSLRLTFVESWPTCRCSTGRPYLWP
ncbi:hypothetical protein V5799_026261 [Amblyomma americanum]|uniref:Uncharacterized protein n=1 Tax=Amblyomma americanum TaxID=6943 RepID=A0AAQ4DJ32_AMBAM